MGTDIRMYIERRSDEYWHYLGKMKINPFYEEDPEHEKPVYPEPVYDTPNESLFAILANVGNDGGFIEKYDCIALPLGLPEDLSPELKSYAEDARNQEIFAASWLTLEELITFDWHGKIRKQYAIVDERVAHLFHPERGFPWSEWPQEIPIRYSFTKKEYANASWTESYADDVGWDVMGLFDNLAKMYGVTDDVRFVLWFRQ